MQLGFSINRDAISHFMLWKGNFTLLLRFYLVKSGNNNFVNTETKLLKLRKQLLIIKKFPFWKPLDGFLCLLGKFYVKPINHIRLYWVLKSTSEKKGWRKSLKLVAAQSSKTIQKYGEDLIF